MTINTNTLPGSVHYCQCTEQEFLHRALNQNPPTYCNNGPHHVPLLVQYPSIKRFIALHTNSSFPASRSHVLTKHAIATSSC